MGGLRKLEKVGKQILPLSLWREIRPCRHLHFSPVQLVLDFGPTELHNNKFVLFYITMFVVIVTAAIENDISLFPDSQKELSQWIKLKLFSYNLSLSFDPATALSPSERWRAETKTEWCPVRSPSHAFQVFCLKTSSRTGDSKASVNS